MNIFLETTWLVALSTKKVILLFFFFIVSFNWFNQSSKTAFVIHAFLLCFHVTGRLSGVTLFCLKARCLVALPMTSGFNFSPVALQHNMMLSLSVANLPPLYDSRLKTIDFLFCEQLLSTEFIMECSFFLMFAIVVFDTPYCSASLRWLSPFCMRSRTSVFCCKLSFVCNFPLAIFTLMHGQYSTVYCITTNTLRTTENNVGYSALTDWLIYHVVWYRVLNFCLFCWLVYFLLLQLCMYSTFHQWTLYILEGERPYDSSAKNRSSETRHNIWLAWSTTMVNIGRYKQ